MRTAGGASTAAATTTTATGDHPSSLIFRTVRAACSNTVSELPSVTFRAGPPSIP